MISKLKQLKGRSLAELFDRGRQKAFASAERVGLSADRRLQADPSFLRLFRDHDIHSADDLFRHFCERKVVFLPSFADRTATLAAFDTYFPDERAQIIERADRVLSGKYDLLGYSGLEFGSPLPDWCLDPVSGKRSSLEHWSRFDETDPSRTGDKKVVWELNRHQYFVLLGQAYWLTGNEEYAETFLAHLDDWIERNPPKMGVNWISSLEIAYRSISWIWAFHFFRDSPLFTPGIFLRMTKVLCLNAKHLERFLSTYSSPNTHLTGEALGLYCIGTFLKEIAAAARWKRLGYAILIEELGRQVRADGGYVEQATHYHRYTADIYLLLAIWRKAEGLQVEPIHEQKLRCLLEYLMFITQPDGDTPAFGDEDGGRLYFLDGRRYADLRSTLAVGATLFGDGSLKTVAGGLSGELLWLLGPEGLEDHRSLKAMPVQKTNRAFEESGIYVMRDGWRDDATFLAIDCGPHGFMNGAHGHADALSFVASFAGVPVFVDSGTYTYTADKAARDHFRSSAAHNCLTVDGKGSAVPNGPFSWKMTPVSKVIEWKEEVSGTVFRGTHDGYERFGVHYERELRTSEDGAVTLVDRIVAATEHEFAISFILSPLVEATIKDGFEVSIYTKVGKRKVLAIVTTVSEKTLGTPGTWQIEATEISPRYGLRVPTTKLIFSITRKADFSVENKFLVRGLN